MRISAWVDSLFLKAWWRYRPGEVGWVAVPYHVFNLFEGTCWIVLAFLVLRRHMRARKSRIEVAYALAFFTFGLTDFREAYALDSWLIWLKLINVLILFRLRSVVVRRFYPESKLF